MIEQEIFKVDTRSINSHLMLRLSKLGIVSNLQAIGAFIDDTKAELAKISAYYYLSRISESKTIGMDAVYQNIHLLVTREMCKRIPSLTTDQIEQARFAILQSISLMYTHEYGSGVGTWDDCRAVSLTPTEYVINATRTRQTSNGVEHQGCFQRDRRWA